ncbi:30S ribosomal protein S4 [Desulfotalea psychrophila]|uniref:Small ribosomal subunit protein uS4 n=1 Tax=Desulfotalea psychrophila (strain LSv54 / DSM 12343) TaxID=177439 RepID=RS4_DESPS|nr:30S ribosomal protein S4 [Desulfotalea psychrophila]Q6AP44.1 RecName: Full=Small ribosomal subunit protein uS4; AltName: Full=30S ribosomal protein S4 [Desulfotalea psychrophila LSv54]CAG35880.1 probable 30S ribosomal protein S4 [Desulfotalea psychrophila LSv54]
MARNIGAVCRRCRRENLKLFLKGDRCYSDKCSFERRAFAPGQHGQARFKKVSDYAVQLREKQKVKSMYGVLEAQFRLTFEKAEAQKGVAGENLLILLERRLDNAVFRAGFASSRTQARQIVRHKHILINGKRVDIPSYQVSEGDVISLREKSRANAGVVDNLEAVVRRGVPTWLELDKDNFKASVKALPNREEITMPIQERLIVELYSKN